MVCHPFYLLSAGGSGGGTGGSGGGTGGSGGGTGGSGGGTGGGAEVVKDPVPAPLDPASLVATTEIVYVVPGLRPSNDAFVLLVVCVTPPTVTVYVTGQPPSGDEALQETAAVVSVATAPTSPGVAGAEHAGGGGGSTAGGSGGGVGSTAGGSGGGVGSAAGV